MGHLFGAAALGFTHGPGHGVGYPVGIQNRSAFQVTRSAAYGLDQRALRAQKTFLVRVQNRHQRDLGNIQPLAQQIDANQHIKRAQAQVAQDLHPLHCVHVAVQVAHLDAVFAQVIGELLGHALGQGGDEHSLGLLDADTDFLQHIVNLRGRGPHFNLRVDQTGGAHHLFDHAPGVFVLPGGGRGRDEYGLTHLGLELFKFERPVVQRAGQAKTIFDQRGLAGAVTVVHAAKLTDQHMAFVQEHQRVFGQVIGQRRRWLACGGAGKVARVVLNAFAVADFAEHFQIKTGALLQPLRLHQLAHADQLFEAVGQFQLDQLHGLQNLLARGDVVAAGVDGEARNFLADATGERIKQLEGLDLVIEQLDAQSHLTVFGGEHVDGVTAHAEGAAAEVHVVALVLHAHQLDHHVALPHLVARAQRHHHLVVRLRFANAVNRRHGGDDHHIAPLQQALGARQAHLLDMLVDRRVFFNEQIALWHIGLGLVVVVVADEILDRVFGEKLAKLAVQLRGQGFVGRKHDRRTPHTGDHIGHGVSLTRAGHAQQGLEHLAVLQALNQLFNRLRLVPGWWVGLVQLKGRVRELHKSPLPRWDIQRMGLR